MVPKFAKQPGRTAWFDNRFARKLIAANGTPKG